MLLRIIFDTAFHDLVSNSKNIHRQQPLTIFIHHFPHSTLRNSAVLYSSRWVKLLIYDTSFLSCVTSRKKGEFGSREMDAHDVVPTGGRDGSGYATNIMEGLSEDRKPELW